MAEARAPDALSRLDSFPYRHRLSDVMTRPARFAPAGTTLGAAARMMTAQGISSLLVGGGIADTAAGIVTERDVLRAVAEGGEAALDWPLERVMSAPVQSLAQDLHLYRAIGRMDRLGLRHLAVDDGAGRIVGMVTARALLKQRAGRALALGDEVAVAPSAAALRAVRDGLPDLARGLLAEGIGALDVAGVISAVVRDMTARAAELAAAEAGPAPAPWCVLVLGSGGRGESLLAFDQDNAIVHAGAPGDDAWFARVGARMNALLDEAGIPLCKGGVMAGNAPWRRSLDGWRDAVAGWIRAENGAALLAVDIFYDFQPVLGERALAEALRRHALAAAGGARTFLRLMAADLENRAPAFGLLGGFRTEAGRIDLKRAGLLPIVLTARLAALKHGIAATSTRARLQALQSAGHLAESAVGPWIEAHETILGAVLAQQLEDLGNGRAPSARVDPGLGGRAARQRLKRALGALSGVDLLARDVLAGD